MSAADLILVNVRGFIGDGREEVVDGVAVRGQRIVFAGRENEVWTWRGPETRVVDGRGGTLLPGFIDSHFHLMWGSLSLGDVDLRGVRTMGALAARIDEALSGPDHGGKEWLVGRNLPYTLPTHDEPLTRQHLDEIVGDRPFVISAYDYHTVWANTAALRAAGLLNGGKAGPNSEIVMLPDGTASGELREPGAYGPLLDLLPEPDEAARLRLLKKGLALAASLGITSVHNMDGDPQQAALYAALEARGELPLRVYMPFDVKPDTPLAALAAEARPMKEQFAGGMVRAGAVKFFMDGVLESYTAYLVDPYADDGRTRGDVLHSPERFREMAAEADRLGLQIAVHACGDGAVRAALDGFEHARRVNGRRDSRHRVEHIELLHPDDLPRFARLGVIASMQPLHAPQIDLDPDVWPDRAGEERWGWSFPWARLRQGGARLVFGSDWPVVTLDPLAGVDAAINRRPWGSEGSGHFRQTLAEVLRSYTWDAAYAEFMEGEKGLIRPGYLADLVLLDHDLFAIPPEAIGEVRPRMTICGGRAVYEAP